MRRITIIGLLTSLVLAGQAWAWDGCGCGFHPRHNKPAWIGPQPEGPFPPTPEAYWYGWGAPTPGATLVPLGNACDSPWAPALVPVQPPKPIVAKKEAEKPANEKEVP